MVTELERPRNNICKPSDSAGYSLPNKTRLITFIISIRHKPFKKRNLCQIQTESDQIVDPSAMAFVFADNVLGSPLAAIVCAIFFYVFGQILMPNSFGGLTEYFL